VASASEPDGLRFMGYERRLVYNGISGSLHAIVQRIFSARVILEPAGEGTAPPLLRVSSNEGIQCSVRW
jgi:hypothetical protein